MKILIEKLAYYLSCMIFFNFIFSLEIFEALYLKKIGKIPNIVVIFNKIALIISVLSIILGIIFTIYICLTNDINEDKNTIGKSIKIKNIKDVTANNYFSNFSLIVLTGLSIPISESYFSCIIYILIIFSLGFVYISKHFFYLNPILSVLKFNVYECDVSEKEGPDKKNIIVITKKLLLNEEYDFNIKNINYEILQLKFN